jgi:hypothetical protein
MRRALRLPLLGWLCLLFAASCDRIKIPAPPSESVGATPAPPAAGSARRKTGAGAKRQPKPDAALDAPRFDQIRRGLRRLVVAEENYYAENGAYTEDLTRIGFTPEGDTRVRFLWLSRGGWAASGTHPDIPSRDCVIYVGRERGAPTTLRDVRSGKEGVPVCDAIPGPRPHRDTVSRPPAEPPSPAPVPDTASALDAVNPSVQMRVDLRNLARSQDTYLGLQGVYSRRTEPFALQYLWHRGVTMTILSADARSWSARATHAARPGKSCVAWFGPVPKKPATEAQQRVPEQPSVPVCDE